MGVAPRARLTRGRRGLEVEEDLEHERLEQRLQRAGRWLCLAFVLAAALGVTGPGWLSENVISDGALSMRYDRTIHRGQPNELGLTIDATGAHDELAIWFARSWLDGVTVELLEPSPLRSVIEPDRVVHMFATNGEGRVRLRVRARARRMGVLDGSCGVAGAPSLAFRQFVLP